ncbi:acyltransferase family protein [Streptomyces sp. SBT349]|uniref:acyltransferase family protein n=1 Tax=Streptomyces sp. SBT349 TaxID=1580539 RepID=UPI00066CA1BB|nr:acyltransferase [Streptomyces sp. SBT349]
MALHPPEPAGAKAGTGRTGSDVAARTVDTAKAYAPAIDGLRASANLMVIAMHVGIYTGQVPVLGTEGPLRPVLNRFTVAVPIFFVISGLLLYRSWADAALDGRKSPSSKRYYWHRVLRIFPAYWLAALAALLMFEAERLDEAARTARVALLWVIYDNDTLTASLAPTWSLATEVSFYALLPILAFVLHRLLRKGRTGPAFMLLGALVVLSVVWVAVLFMSPEPMVPPLERRWLPAYISYFAAGMALALLASHSTRSANPPAIVVLVSRHPWACWGVALAAHLVNSTSLAGDIVMVPTASEAVVEHVCHLVTAVCLAAPLLFANGSRPARMMAFPVLAWLGRISYGTFLWHMVIILGWIKYTDKEIGTLDISDFLLLYPLTLALSITLGWLSYVLIEQPTRHLRPLVKGR